MNPTTPPATHGQYRAIMRLLGAITPTRSQPKVRREKYPGQSTRYLDQIRPHMRG